MTTLNREIYEAFQATGIEDAKAKAAAASVYDKEQIATKVDIAEIKGALTLVQWMLGFNLALSVTMVLAAIGPYLAKIFVR